eukprot:scaffold72383_cov44-Phaeocystis_antarctica.AAC.2
MVSPADPSAMASTARGRRQCEGLSVARLRGLRGPASYNTILFNRGRPAADSCTTPSRELREVWRRGHPVTFCCDFVSGNRNCVRSRPRVVS